MYLKLLNVTLDLVSINFSKVQSMLIKIRTISYKTPNNWFGLNGFGMGFCQDLMITYRSFLNSL